MKKLERPRRPLPTTIAIVFATMVMGGLASDLCFGGSDSAVPPSQTNTSSSQSSVADATPPAPQGITGAELYSIHCNRCHPERYPTERTAANWKTINLHMQVRANIPPAQARLILKYLQDNSGR